MRTAIFALRATEIFSVAGIYGTACFYSAERLTPVEAEILFLVLIFFAWLNSRALREIKKSKYRKVKISR